MIHKCAREDRFSEGFKDGLPICFGYLSVSFAFGIFCVNQGLKIWQAVFMSMTNVTSAGQLAAVPIITGGLSLAELALSQLVINMRYALMSVSISQKLDGNVRLCDRLIIAFMNTDEIFAVASGRAHLVGRHYFYGLMISPYIGWATGTAIGGAAGNILPQPVVNALGIAIYGMFIAIIIPAAKKSKNVFFAVLAACVMSIVFHYAPVLRQVSAGFVIIICAVTVSAVFAAVCPAVNDAAEEDNV